MVKNIKLKKVFALLAVFAMTFVTMPISNVNATVCGLQVSAPSSTEVEEGGSITFKLTFSGDVANISLRDSAIGLVGFTATKTFSGTGNVRTVTLSNIQGVGTGKYIKVAGGVAITSTGSGSNAVNSSVFTVKAKDSEAPKLVISEPSSKTVYAGETVTYKLNFTDNVGIVNISLRNSAIKLEGFTADIKISGSGNAQRTVTLSNIQGTVGAGKYIKVAGGVALDAKGNGSNAANSETFTIAQKDDVAPVLKIEGPDNKTVYAGGTVTYKLNFTDNVGIVNISLRNSAIKLEGFTADIKISGSGNAQRTVTLSNIQGTVGAGKYIKVAGGVALDAKGNGSNAANSETFAIVQKDDVAPVLKIEGPDNKTVYAGGTVTYKLNFTDNIAVVNISLRNSAIKLEGFTADIKISGSGNAQRTVTLSNIQGTVGAGKYIKVAGGVALDAMGNGSNAANSDVFTIAKKVEEKDTVDKEDKKPDTEPTKPEQTKPEQTKPNDWKDNPNTGI